MSMRIVLDTNIILDVLARREPFFDQSNAIMQLVAESKIVGAMTANSVTDIHYILRKHLSTHSLKTALRALMELVDVISVTEFECVSALDSPIDDFEDALLACCAKTWEADCIITRDVRDFAHSPVQALSPKDFLSSLSSY